MNLLAALDTIEELHCENESDIIEGFMERYDVTCEEATEILDETKKWLWLAAESEVEGKHVFIDTPLLVIDEMWHTFILHTKQYYNFCLGNFRKLIHHIPTTPRKKTEIKLAFEKNPSKAVQEHEEKVKEQYSLIYDKLGPETLLKWYDTMAQKYTPEYLQSIKKF